MSAAYVSTFVTDDGDYGWFCQTCDDEGARSGEPIGEVLLDETQRAARGGEHRG